MARWPNVPAVYGWLSLDRRGVRAAAVRRHSADRMVDEYVCAYEAILRNGLR